MEISTPCREFRYSNTKQNLASHSFTSAYYFVHASHHLERQENWEEKWLGKLFIFSFGGKLNLTVVKFNLK